MKKIIKTSEKDWLEKAIINYREKKEFVFEDDAKLGIKEDDLKSAVNLIRSGISEGNISWKNITGILASIGITGVGIYVIRAAIIDPEPTSKLGLLITGGLILLLTGSLGGLASLGVNFSVSLKSVSGQFVIKPEMN